MKIVKQPLSVQELMNITDEDAFLLGQCLLPNSDEQTDNKQWEENGIRGVKLFVDQSAGAINLLLGRK